MEYIYKKLSEKKCKELEAMDIKCPISPGDYYGNGSLNCQNVYAASNLDETEIFMDGFFVLPASRDWFDDIYILILNDKIYYVQYEKFEDKGEDYLENIIIRKRSIAIKIINDNYSIMDIEIMLNKLKEMIAAKFKRKPDEEYLIDLFYKGKEI